MVSFRNVNVGLHVSGAVPRRSAPSMFCYRDFLEFIFKPLIMCKCAWQTHCPCTCPQSQEESNGFLSGRVAQRGCWELNLGFLCKSSIHSQLLNISNLLFWNPMLCTLCMDILEWMCICLPLPKYCISKPTNFP